MVFSVEREQVPAAHEVRIESPGRVAPLGLLVMKEQMQKALDLGILASAEFKAGMP